MVSRDVLKVLIALAMILSCGIHSRSHHFLYKINTMFSEMQTTVHLSLLSPFIVDITESGPPATAKWQ